MLYKFIICQLFNITAITAYSQATLPVRDTVKELAELVVTGTYKPMGLDKCVIQTRNILVEKLSSIGVQNVGDVLKYQANIRLQPDNILGTGMSLQGISGENVKILIDGVPVIGRQNGNIDLSQLNIQNVERIEIIEGPMSVQYGTNALAGTLNIITKKNTIKGIDGQINTYTETVGHLNIGSHFGWKGRTQSLRLSGGRNFFQGWSNSDTSRFKDWKPRIQYFADMNYQFSLGKVKFGYAAHYFEEFILNRGRPLSPYLETAFDDKYTTNRFSNALNATFISKNDVKTSFIASYSNYKRLKNTYYKDLIKLSETLTSNLSDQDTTTFKLISTRGTLSKSSNKTLNYELGVDVNVEKGSGLRIKENKQVIGDYAAFISTEYKIKDNLTLRPGLRASYNTSYKAPLIPSFHVRWAISPDFTARASWAKGFRAPSLKELYFYFVDINHNIQGNKNLIAESSQNVNLALNFKKAVSNDIIYKSDISGFANDIRNLISLVLLRGGTNDYSYVNIDKFRTFGGQIQGEMRVNTFNIALGTSFTSSENTFNKTLFKANTWSYQGHATWTNIAKTKCDANIWYKYAGKQGGFIQNQDGQIEPTFIGAYSLADAGISRKFFKEKLNMAFGIRNIFNVKNVEAQLAGGVHAAGEGVAALATGRSLFLKIDIGL